MSEKKVPFDKKFIEELVKDFPTPFHIYDEKAIRENARKFYKEFDWAPHHFRNYFAVKALPNPYILRILKEEGMGADCSSLPELLLAEKVGFKGGEIIFTSNDTPLEEFKKAKELGAIINLDDLTHIKEIEKIGLPEILSFRYNPGPLKKGNEFIGSPEEAKYGVTFDQLFEGFKILKDKGVEKFGIHTMVASNELNEDYFIETADILLSALADVMGEVGINFEFVNFGGGLGIPYKPDEKPIDLKKISKGIKRKYTSYIATPGDKPPRLCFESGRMVTGPYGYLVTKVIHEKDTYKHYKGVDSCMSALMRPGLYGAYHHITVLGKENEPASKVYDITGSLCENNDKFAIDRKLPSIEIGDYLAIHDTGAHGSAMGFNYNGKLRPAELLLKEDGSVKMIRRAETVEDYFSTLDFSDFDN